MYFWIGLFTTPIVLLTAILIYLLVMDRSELCQPIAWAAILSGYASPVLSLWGLARQSASPMALVPMHGFDRKIWLVAIVAALLGLTWLIQSRRWYAFLVLIISFMAAAFWTTVIRPF
jgi:hypothetical protein